jgi:hypothetical protein
MKDIANPPAAVRAAEDLESLAQQINEREEQGVRSLLEHAKAQGEDLLRAKKRAGHGKWLKWVEANLSFSHDTAGRYMLIAEKWDEDKFRNVRNLSDAIRLLTAPAPPSTPPRPQRPP